MMVSFALVPFRGRTDPKRRLAAVLSPRERVALAEAMLLDVVDALRTSMSMPQIFIVSSEFTMPIPADCTSLKDSGDGLNAAISGAFDALRAEFGTRVPILVVPADLPLLRATIVDQAFDALADANGFVLAPALVDGGTNLLGQAATCPVSPCFGADSFRAHRAAALDAGLSVTTIDDPDVECDIDRPDDLMALAASCRATRSTRFARAWRDARPASAHIAKI
jgi:2-phospho-L-lactate guanylyltransferase